MSEENKIVEEHHKCLCESKGFRKFLIVAGGTFVGVFLALSLFAALHKPPMMQPVPFGGPMMRPCPCGCHHYSRVHNFERGYRGDCHKKMVKERCDKKIHQQAAEEIDD